MTDASDDRELGEVLDELVDAVLETKQALWSAPWGAHRKALEDLTSFLVEQTQVVAAEEERIGGRAPWITTMAGRRPQNLMAQAGGRPDRAVALLMEHLRGVAADVRAHAERVHSSAESDLLRELADGLERHLAVLDRSEVSGPGVTT
jgi:hypothetical protein